MVRILRKLNLWVIFFTLLSYLAPFVRPSLMSLLMFAGLAYPWLLVANLIFIGLWAFSRMRYWWWSTVVVLMGFNYLLGVFGVNYLNQDTIQDLSKQVKIMSYNTGGYEFLYYKDKSTAADRMSAAIKKENPDVLCLQEHFDGVIAHEMVFRSKVAALSEYPYFFIAADCFNGIFSRYPILNSGILDTKKLINGCIFADIQFPQQVVRVYAAHLASNKVSGIAARLADKGDIIDDDSWWAFGRMLALVRRKGIVREREAALIREHIQSSPYPVILCGDFNDIPVSYTYSVLSEGMNDAFVQKGQGIGTTYNGKIPALRIDYILTSPSLKPVDFQIIKNRFSDHYPVVSSIQLGN
jgi:endonuclease/exonuclease/phosphatase family metal-dependent hydrolase